MKPTAAAVWEAFCLDSEFARSAPADNPHFEAMRPFIEGSVTALDGYFDTFVSVASICVAKQKFLRHCMALNIGGVMAELMGTDEGLINEMLTGLADQLDDLPCARSIRRCRVHLGQNVRSLPVPRHTFFQPQIPFRSQAVPEDPNANVRLATH